MEAGEGFHCQQWMQVVLPSPGKVHSSTCKMSIYLNTSKKIYMCKYLYKYIYIVVNIYIYTYTPQYLSFLFLSLDLQICTTEETDAPDLSPMSSRTGSETLSLSVSINFSIYIYELLAYAWKTSVRMDNHWWQYQYQRKQKDQ